MLNDALSEVKTMSKWKLIWRLLLIIGWGVCSFLAFNVFEKETIEKMYFVCCWLLVFYNIEKLLDGK